MNVSGCCTSNSLFFSRQESHDAEILGTVEYYSLLEFPGDFQQWCAELAFALDQLLRREASSEKRFNPAQSHARVVTKLAEVARNGFDKNSEDVWKREPWTKTLPPSLHRAVTDVFLVGTALEVNMPQRMPHSGARAGVAWGAQSSFSPGMPRGGHSVDPGRAFDAGWGKVRELDPRGQTGSWEPPPPPVPPVPPELQAAAARAGHARGVPPQQHATFHGTSGRPQGSCGPSSQGDTPAAEAAAAAAAAPAWSETRTQFAAQVFPRI